MRDNLTTSEADVWVLLDDRAGNRAQSLGVAENLNIPFKIIEIKYGPLIKLPNVILGASLMGVTSETKSLLKAPWPKLVIAAGRRTAPAARWVKRQNGPTTRLVQIMDPGSGHVEFDLICRPTHDEGQSESNIFEIPAAPHGFNAEKLTQIANNWAHPMGDLPTPRIALLIGGSTRRRNFTQDMAQRLCTQASAAAAKSNGSLMVTTSRRTGDVIGAVEASLSGNYQLHRWDDDAENPYAAYLATADAIIVTGESVSMCSEAVSTGKPVYIFAPSELITAKHARLHQALLAGGYARLFEGDVDLTWRPTPLVVADEIVAAIKDRKLLGAS